MNKKQLGAAVLYFVAVALPTAAVALRYGFETRVALGNSSEAMGQILAMAGGVVSGFLIGMFAGRLQESDSESLLRFATRTLQQLVGEHRPKHST